MTAAVSVVLLAAACEPGAERHPRARSRPSPRSQLEIGEVNTFVPATNKENGKLVMPVTFPDGSAAEIVYPPALRIAEMGAQPYSSGGLHECCASDFLIFHGAVPEPELHGKAPLAVYRGANGTPVEYWRVGSQGHDPAVDRWLIFSFGRWKLFAHDSKNSMTQQQLEVWARSLHGEETSDGFLHLRAQPPLRLTRAGEHAGPELLFATRSRMVILFVGECSPDRTEDAKVVPIGGKSGPRADWFASRCFENRSMRLHVQSDSRRFAKRVMESVIVRNVRLAS